MQELDKKEIYSLEGLNDEQRKKLSNKSHIHIEDLRNYDYIYYGTWWWCYGNGSRKITAKAIDLFNNEIKREVMKEIKKGQIWEHVKTGERVEIDKLEDGYVYLDIGRTTNYHSFLMFWELVEEKAKPSQYQIGIDTFARCEANMTKEEILACCKFNIDKYNWRQKNQDKQDLEKIIHYAQWALKQLK